MYWLLQLIVVVVVGISWWMRPRKQGLAPTIPGALPIIGHTYLALYAWDTISLWNIVKFMGQKCLQTGGVGKTTLGFWTVYIITDPDASYTLLNTCLEKDDVYKMWKPWLGLGLVTAPVSMWRAHRKLILPMFNQQMLNQYLIVFNETANEIVQRIKPRVGNGPFNITGDLSYGFLRTILKSAMGYEPEDKQDLKLYRHSVEEFLRIASDRATRLFYHIDAIYNWSQLKKDQDHVMKDLRLFTEKMLKSRRKAISNLNGTFSTVDSNHKLFLDHLLEAQDKGLLTETEVRNEVDTIVFAGHDTSAVTTVIALVMIGSFPEVQERVYKEIIDIFGHGDVNVRMEDISKMAYLDAVFKESVRMYPFSSFLAREIDRNLELNGYTIPKGSRVMVLTQAIQQHSVWGPDADQFKPERWLDPTRVPISPGAFNGFSVGKRACIGKRYAVLVIKTILIHIVRRYRLTANHENMVLKFEGVTKPASGHQISIELRK